MGYVIWLLDFSMGLFYTKLTNIRNRLKDKLRIEEK